MKKTVVGKIIVPVLSLFIFFFLEKVGGAKGKRMDSWPKPKQSKAVAEGQ